MRLATLAFFLLMVVPSPRAHADPDDIPCGACEPAYFPPLPESGVWSDPDRFGTGFMLQVQREELAGAYFGYDAQGRATWYVFSGRIERGRFEESFEWSLEAQAIEWSGGACLLCVPRSPDASRIAASLRFEFLQRSLARVRVDDREWRYLRPQTFGVETSQEFSPAVSFPVPDLQGEWVLVHRHDGTAQYPRSRVAFLTSDITPPRDGRIVSLMVETNVVTGTLECADTDDGTPQCSFTYSNLSDEKFFFPLGNLSASRFKAEAANGETIEAFRLMHD
jgi:hypothetical protein